MAKPDENAEAVMRGLIDLDTTLREANHANAPKGAEIAGPGVGLHQLLALVGSQFLGVPVTPYPQEEAAPAGATGATGAGPHVEAGSLSAQAIEAGKEPATGEGHHGGPKAENGKHPDPKRR